MKTLFLDTNIFLQCKDLRALPWENLSENSCHLKLLIPRGTQIEIDNFKNQGNSRRSKKARAASAYFREILQNPNRVLVIKGQVSVGFPSRKELNTIEREPRLDTNRNDDLIIQDIIAYRSLHSEEEVFLISDDTNLINTAIDYDVPYIILPSEWLLAPEPDESSKAINILKDEISRLKKNIPEIEITASCNQINLSVSDYQKLTDEQISNIIEPIMARAKLDDSSYKMFNSSSHFIGLYQKPSQSIIDSYNSEKLQDWKEDAEYALQSAHWELNNKLNCVMVEFSLANIGNVTAENLIIEFTASNNLSVFNEAQNKSLSKTTILPDIPIAPRPQLIGMPNSLIDVFNSPITFSELRPLNTQRDRNKFYWSNVFNDFPEGQRSASCEEFRHKALPEKFTMYLMVESGTTPTGGELKCTVSAKNLPDPKQLSIPVKIDFKQGDSVQAFYDNYNDIWK